jgi:hypothetical protein
MSLATLVWAVGCTHGHYNHLHFRYVGFLVVSHMTYCSKTRDKKTALRERVNHETCISPLAKCFCCHLEVTEKVSSFPFQGALHLWSRYQASSPVKTDSFPWYSGYIYSICSGEIVASGSLRQICSAEFGYWLYEE